LSLKQAVDGGDDKSLVQGGRPWPGLGTLGDCYEGNQLAPPHDDGSRQRRSGALGEGRSAGAVGTGSSSGGGVRNAKRYGWRGRPSKMIEGGGEVEVDDNERRKSRRGRQG
jgi:hypothetical protein